MNKMRAIIMENSFLRIHPIRETELIDLDRFQNDIFEILSDESNTRFIEEKRVKSIQEISDQLMGTVFSYEKNTGYMYFLTRINPIKTIGAINILPPTTVENNYPLKNTWLIEYYLNKEYWGNGIMGGAVNAIIKNLQEQGIEKIGAFTFEENEASIRILENCGFENIDLSERGLYSFPSPQNYTQLYFEIEN